MVATRCGIAWRALSRTIPISSTLLGFSLKRGVPAGCIAAVAAELTEWPCAAAGCTRVPTPSIFNFSTRRSRLRSAAARAASRCCNSEKPVGRAILHHRALRLDGAERLMR